jgi:hypothetical protein
VRPRSSAQLLRPSTAPSSRISKSISEAKNFSSSSSLEFLPPVVFSKKSDFIPYMKGKTKHDARDSFKFLRSLSFESVHANGLSYL